MNKFLKLIIFIIVLIVARGSGVSYAQSYTTPRQQPGMGAGKFNYETFTPLTIDTCKEIPEANEGYKDDPELGMHFKETPCKDCYEVISKRTEQSKTYIKKGTGGKQIMAQSASAPMHYRDSNGRWRTIKSRLQPASEGIYAATEQPCPVMINAESGYSSLGKPGKAFKFNNQLELLFEKADGTVIPLGKANWSKYTAGDDGAYVTDAWPGIDIEIHSMRGFIKTNFWIQHSLPEYADGTLRVRDHLGMDKGLYLDAHGETKHTGVMNIKNTEGRTLYIMSEATAFELGNGVKTLRSLNYLVGENNTLDIALPGDYLNRPSSSYPVIIDPLITDSTGVTIPGSTYSPAWTVGCNTNNPATVPADLTITDLWFTFEYLASGGALMTNGALDFHLGTCRSPDLAGYYWYCLVYAAGACGGIDVSFFAHVAACVPPVRCYSYDLNISMNMYQNYLSDPPCSNIYITATEPLFITVVGYPLAEQPIAVTGPSTICAGQTTSMTASATYGKIPYSYSWSPGGMTTPTVFVSPAVTTTYTCVVTDSCGFRDTAVTTITVNPISPITGITNACIGGITTLSDAVTGGTWTSSNTAIATADPSTGAVTGVSAGTCTITYTTAAGCTATATVTVFPSPNISSFTSSDPTNCVSTDGSITLNGLTPGSLYTVNYNFDGTPVTVILAANSSGQVIISGLAGGSYYNITVTTGTGCVSNLIPGPIVLNIPPPPPTPVATNSSPICAGQAVSFTATDALLTGITYSWTGPLGFTSTLQNPFIAAAYPSAAGTYNVTVTDGSGCVSAPASTVVVVHPIPDISGAIPNNPSVCLGADGSITLTGLLPGVSYTVNYTFGGAPFTITVTGDATGQVIITGLGSGVYSNINVSAFGCPSNDAVPVTLTDPGAPPTPQVSSNSPICTGSVLLLYASDSMAGVSYAWSGPNGFISTLQNPEIFNTPAAAAGTYTVVVASGLCTARGTTDVILFPPVVLINVTPDQVIPFGSTVQLYAAGADLYVWTPDNGTLSNQNINNPKARPTDNTTYIVMGMNSYGCKDTAQVNITIEYTDTALIPTAFTPNGDGLNDIFRIANIKDLRLVEFSIYNRWGQQVYHNEWDIKQGWDGTFNGVPQDLGNYQYFVILARPNGENITYKGDVTLIR